MVRPALKREVVDYIVDHYGLKLARACRLIKQVRSTQYLSSKKDPKLALRQLDDSILHDTGFGVSQNDDRYKAVMEADRNARNCALDSGLLYR